MEINSASIKEQIPYYLSDPQKQKLVEALEQFEKFHGNCDYFLNRYSDELLQGDGWTKLRIRRFDSGEDGSILGIILSNTCDVSHENPRDLPVKITFAPIIPLAKYIDLLKIKGVDPDKIHNKVSSIEKQTVSNIFFLPAAGYLKESHIALLDEVYTMPVKIFESESEKTKAFTLSMFGFFLFIFKLSYHFCRFSEAVPRN